MSLESVLVNWREFATSKRWASQLQKRNEDKIIPPKTDEAMNTWMPQFLRFHQKSPDGLIEEAISDNDIAEQRLDDFYRYKKKIIDRNSCITGIYGTLRGFYRHNNVNVQNITSPKFSPRQVKKTDANYPLFKKVEYEKDGKIIKKLVLNRELLQEFASHLNSRDQCILLCILSSGLDSNDILKLTVGDIRRQEAHSRIYLNDARNKTFREYKDFFSTEATIRLRTYVRKQRRDALDEEPLFVTSVKARKSDFKKKTGMLYKLGDKLPKGHRLSSGELSDAFRTAQKAMGIHLEKAKQSPLRPKRFRKIFRSACTSSQIDTDITKIFLGHAGASSQDYEEDSREILEFYYEMVEPKIMLYKDEDMEQDEVLKLQKQIAFDRKEKEDMRKDVDSKLESMQNTINSLLQGNFDPIALAKKKTISVIPDIESVDIFEVGKKRATKNN